MAGVIGAVVVGGVGVKNATDAKQAADDQHRINDAALTVKDINFYNGDLTGWQLAYALDARNNPPAQAVSDESPNIQGFQASKANLLSLMDGFPTEELTSEERALFDDMATQWDKFFATD